MYKSYQMNPANYREALVELHADEAEGADILLVNICSSTVVCKFPSCQTT